ncbi:ATP synthase F1 subunit delta [Mesonia aestuariivivens]|uniref:ATP synthase subunit delta n=1 Tax=Mesonia aestuariivivens TaxID=2796128 RepID=A0ABS6VZ47_9FLAO|nr:ATP synthase F1 subunit delta [Mesonia aestuariivivens]MBW2960193.1 ATP synthase F1 subunit delta [Mesonia aestuariivivens]
MASSRAAQRYAKALLDLAQENKNQEAVNKEVRDIYKTLINSQELRNVLKSPVVKPKLKVNALNAIFKDASVTLKNLFKVLAANSRIADLHLVAHKFIELYDERNNVKVARVTTAETLTPEMEAKILTKVKALTGSEVTLKSKIDKAILGGFILRIGDQQYDASIQGKLNALKTRFKNKAHV